MADVQTRTHQVVIHPQQRPYEGGIKVVSPPQSGPSSTQVLATIAGIPIGGTLLTLAGLTLAGSVIGVMLSIPLLLLFSPIIVPAAIVIGLAMTGFLTAGAFGLTGLSSMSWVLNYIRRARYELPEEFEDAKQRLADMAEYVGQRTKDAGQSIEDKAQDVRETKVGYEGRGGVGYEVGVGVGGRGDRDVKVGGRGDRDTKTIAST